MIPFQKSYVFEDVSRGSKGTVVFICNHCPFVIHVNDELVRLANDYRVTGFGFVAISSNDGKNLATTNRMDLDKCNE
jgi:hypothetical protein